ncbi:MAG: tetratricopeptide repeat protein [Cellulophaga sp.]|nr:tetratricopeptide repeat protein [Cellulophaga sp.]
MKNLVYLLLLVTSFVNAQQDIDKEKEKEKLKKLQESKNYTWDANKALSEKDFVNAEADYRKAISKSTENAAAPYNLGNAYYAKETFSEAFSRFKQAGELATSKEAKHKAYHNMGNVFMKEKQYEKAVEGYKQALRNDPTDEETRYNLALAQEMLKKQQDEDEKNKDKDDKDDENKDDKKDKEEDKKEGDNKDDKGDQKDDQKKDEGDKEDQKDKEGEGDKKEDEKKPKEGDKPKDQKGQPEQRPSQLSPQQVQNLLEAMQNEEKKVQEKMDAKKVKGVKTKNEKDW